MSVLEELRSIEQQVLARLRELEPLVAEYADLRQAAERLNLDYDPKASAPARGDNSGQPAAGASPRKPTRRASSRRAAKRGRRRAPVSFDDRAAQVLAEISTNPGTTVPQLGKRLNVDYTGLYRVVRKLEQDGAIRRSGSSLELATRTSR